MTTLIPLTSILIPPDRQRQHFDGEALSELGDSIDRRGLLHPLSVERSSGQLIAGESRLRAIQGLFAFGKAIKFEGKLLEPGIVPVLYYDELSPLERAEIEYEENTRRRDLTWQENVAAIAKLDSIKAQLATLRGEQHSRHDTAEELYGKSGARYSNQVRQAVILNQHLHDPEVRASRTPEDAFKLLQRREEIERAKAVKEVRSKHTLIEGDCIPWLQACPGSTFDCIITDPPYGIDIGDDYERRAKQEYEDSYQEWERLMTIFPFHAWRVLKENSHIWIFCDYSRFGQLNTLMSKAHFTCYPRPIIRTMGGSAGRFTSPLWPRRDYDCILFAHKGKRELIVAGADVIIGPSRMPVKEKSPHGAQKPVECFAELLRRSVESGAKVLDPFAGSGTIFEAAEQRGCYATGIELNPDYAALCRARLEKLEKK